MSHSINNNPAPGASSSALFGLGKSVKSPTAGLLGGGHGGAGSSSFSSLLRSSSATAAPSPAPQATPPAPSPAPTAPAPAPAPASQAAPSPSTPKTAAKPRNAGAERDARPARSEKAAKDAKSDTSAEQTPLAGKKTDTARADKSGKAEDSGESVEAKNSKRSGKHEAISVETGTAQPGSAVASQEPIENSTPSSAAALLAAQAGTANGTGIGDGAGMQAADAEAGTAPTGKATPGGAQHAKTGGLEHGLPEAKAASAAANAGATDVAGQAKAEASLTIDAKAVTGGGEGKSAATTAAAPAAGSFEAALNAASAQHAKSASEGATTADTAAPAQVVLAQPLHDANFAPEMAARLSLLAADGVQQAELHLNPAEMGPVAVQIVVDGQQAQISFHSEQAETRAVLERGLPELAAALRDTGLTLSGGGVFQQQAREQGQGGQGASTAARGRAGESELDERTIAAATAPRAPARSRGVLDLYA